MKKKRVIIILSITFFLLTMGILEFFGIIWHTEVFTVTYDVKGIDVSHYQHAIDWEQVPSKDYKFVFMKATEGEEFVDKTFNINWMGARDNGFLVGAYHFFVTSSSGEAQAQNFIDTVPATAEALPAVIDIEINISENKTSVRDNLNIMIMQLHEAYGKMPILYVTHETYDAYIKGYFQECPIWIRDIVKHPKLKDEREWVFWQYCNRGRVEGIDTYVDINVFKGSKEELYKLTNSY